MRSHLFSCHGAVEVNVKSPDLTIRSSSLSNIPRKQKEKRLKKLLFFLIMF